MANNAAVYFSQWTASGGDDVVGSVSFTAWTASASGYSNPVVAASFEGWTATGLATPGPVTEVSFEEWTATGEAHGTPIGQAAVSFEAWTAAAYDRPIVAGTIELWTATGYSRGHVNAAAAFEAWIVAYVSAYTPFAAWTASSRSQSALSGVYSGKVMNARSGVVTEYTNYEFNSFAKIGSSYYGAGPNGLFRLDGDDDNGTNINWVVRTGQHDDKDPGLKRLPEILASLRASGPVRVRVYRDDNVYYDYMIPAVRTNTLSQRRVTPGKGMRSRYYAVELQGVANSDLELDSMQVNMTPTTRRVG